jgi:hypothetical protein
MPTCAVCVEQWAAAWAAKQNVGTPFAISSKQLPTPETERRIVTTLCERCHTEAGGRWQ